MTYRTIRDFLMDDPHRTGASAETAAHEAVLPLLYSRASIEPWTLCYVPTTGEVYVVRLGHEEDAEWPSSGDMGPVVLIGFAPTRELLALALPETDDWARRPDCLEVARLLLDDAQELFELWTWQGLERLLEHASR